MRTLPQFSRTKSCRALERLSLEGSTGGGVRGSSCRCVTFWRFGADGPGWGGKPHFTVFYMTIQFLLSTERTVTRGAHEGFRPTTGRVFKQVFASSERLFACRTYMADRWLHVTV